MTTYYLTSPLIRSNAIRAVDGAEDGMIVTVKKPTRSTRQNALLWALLNDLSKAEPEGRKWTPDTFKAAMMHHLGHQVVFAEGLGNSGPFPMGFRSSHLTSSQMTDLIDCILAYGFEHGVVWRETSSGGFGEFLERAGK